MGSALIDFLITLIGLRSDGQMREGDRRHGRNPRR